MGIVRNFEAAVASLDTELIFLCDQDHIWLPHKISMMTEVFAQQPDLLLLHTDAYLVDAAAIDLGVSLFDANEVSSQERVAVQSGKALRVLCRRNLVTGATVAFRRRLLDVALPFPASWLHDEWLAIIAAACGRISLLDSPTILYRQHGGNPVGMALPDKTSGLISKAKPGGEFHATRAARAAVLTKRLSELSQVSAGACELVRRLQVHVEFRAHLPANALRRVAGVFVEWRRGSYRLFSNGIYGALRDVINH